jgi:hypothetical protein
MRILSGRIKGDSLDRPTFHGNNGISTVDYIICDQEIFQNVNYFVVKPPTYLSDHSLIVTWIDIEKSLLDSEKTWSIPEQTLYINYHFNLIGLKTQKKISDKL